MVVNWYQYAQFFGLFVALCCFTGLKRFSIAAFIPLLIIINAVEITGRNFRVFGWPNNYFIYNLYLVLSTPLVMHLYAAMLRLKGLDLTVLRVMTLLVMLLILINYFFVQGIYVFNTYSLIGIEVLNVIFSCLVLFRLLLQDLRETNLFHEPFFVINASNLLFSLVALVVLGLQQYITANHVVVQNRSLYNAIMPAANVFLYTGYSFAFLLCQLHHRRSSQ